MGSAINPAYPAQGNPTTKSVRDNFLAAKLEIEALQQRPNAGGQSTPDSFDWAQIAYNYDTRHAATDGAYSTGTKFSVARDCKFIKWSYYWPEANTQTIALSLWDANGAILASKTTDITGRANIHTSADHPINLTAGLDYTVSVDVLTVEKYSSNPDGPNTIAFAQYQRGGVGTVIIGTGAYSQRGQRPIYSGAAYPINALVE